jgi:hypothetical protein
MRCSHAVCCVRFELGDLPGAVVSSSAPLLLTGVQGAGGFLQRPLPWTAATHSPRGKTHADVGGALSADQRDGQLHGPSAAPGEPRPTQEGTAG